MNAKLEAKLNSFQQAHRIASSKGRLSLVLHVTRLAKNEGLPLDPDDLRTPSQGQVRGLGWASVQSILRDYNITRVLAREAGRTSRGNIDLMIQYVRFLNDLAGDGLADLDVTERWWIGRVQAYFASRPFILRYDTSKSIGAIIRELLDQARDRQAENLGATYVGTVLQHLVGAKLELVLRNMDITINHHGASVADSPTARQGDFVIGDSTIHVTTAPTQSLMLKCKENLAAGYKPIIVTVRDRVAMAEGNAETEGIGERTDILAAEQFLAANLHELSGFEGDKQRTTIDELVAEYNKIIEEHETDQSMKISVGR